MEICFIWLTLINNNVLLIDVNSVGSVYVKNGNYFITGTRNYVKETPQQIFSKILECKND